MAKTAIRSGLRISQQAWKNAMGNQSGLGDLSPLKFLVTSKISDSSKVSLTNPLYLRKLLANPTDLEMADQIAAHNINS